MTDPLNECWSFKLVFEKVGRDLGYLCGTKINHKVLLHVGNLFRLLRLNFITTLNWDESVVEIDSGQSLNIAEVTFASGNGFIICRFSVLVIHALLEGTLTAFVGDESHDDQDKEETKGQVCLVWLHNTVEKYNVEPDVSND